MSANVTAIQSAIDHTSPAIRTVRKSRNVGQNMGYAAYKKKKKKKARVKKRYYPKEDKIHHNLIVHNIVIACIMESSCAV